MPLTLPSFLLNLIDFKLEGYWTRTYKILLDNMQDKNPKISR